MGAMIRRIGACAVAGLLFSAGAACSDADDGGRVADGGPRDAEGVEDASPDDGGVRDGDASGSDAAASGACDPVENTGCGAGEWCKLDPASGVRRCRAEVTSGVAEAGESCDLVVGDCVAGSVCAQLEAAASPVCAPVCRGTDSSTCGGAAACIPVGDGGFGLCFDLVAADRCDPEDPEASCGLPASCATLAGFGRDGPVSALVCGSEGDGGPGAECSRGGGCRPGLVCLAQPGGLGLCVETCDGASDCSEDRPLCLPFPRSGGEPVGLCNPSCDPAAGIDACPEGFNCQLVVAPEVRGICTPAGEGGLGARCRQQDFAGGTGPCEAGTFCFEFTLANIFVSRCTTTCDEASPCPNDGVCVVPDGLPTGICVFDDGCELGTSTGCEAEETCRYVVTPGFAAGSRLVNACSADGRGELGTPCSALMQCQSELLCAPGLSGDLGCREACATNTDCTDGQCLVFASVPPFSACYYDGCQPLEPDTCDGGRVCNRIVSGATSFLDACIAPGSREPLEACEGPLRPNQCRAPAMCSSLTNVNAGAPTCFVPCAPSSPSCPEGSGCAEIIGWDDDVGLCIPN